MRAGTITTERSLSVRRGPGRASLERGEEDPQSEGDGRSSQERRKTLRMMKGRALHPLKEGEEEKNPQ